MDMSNNHLVPDTGGWIYRIKNTMEGNNNNNAQGKTGRTGYSVTLQWVALKRKQIQKESIRFSMFL
jgi:hypothetical protein